MEILQTIQNGDAPVNTVNTGKQKNMITTVFPPLKHYKLREISNTICTVV